MSLINKKRILCIEDDQDTCDLLAAALRVSGYEAVFAHTLADGITLARSEPFALYLLDNWLPDGTGLEACKWLRTLQPPRPVVFCSGAAYEADHQRAMEAGAQAYLDKPFEIDCLLETVQRLIGAQ